MIGKINLDEALNFFAPDPQDLDKVKKEFDAFLNFAKAQAERKSVTHQNRDAINFADRWTAVQPFKFKKLQELFGDSYLTIFNTTVALATFGLIGPFDRPI